MRHGVPLAALLSAVLVGVVATACREQPTGPEADGTAPVRPRFSFTGGSGKILASTNQGELVEIDFDAGTAELLGDAGTFGGDSVGWTDIAFDDSGTLYGVSRIFFESDFEVHLYTIDPSDGSVISDLGSIGDHTFSDFDHDGSGFYGNGKNDLFDCCGQLFSLDETTPSATWISSDTTGFGLNPYDTVHNYPLTQGGFAVHPSTGELWGIESNAFVPTIFRIDRSSGVADSVIPLAVDSGAVLDAGGFDGLHILDDGTFIATLSGPSPLDSALWEIDPTLDSLGRAPVGLISLAYGSEIVGHLNGLTRAAPPAYSLTLTADTTELHPWVRKTTFWVPLPTDPTRDSLFAQSETRPDSAVLTVQLESNGQGAPNREVKWSAELLKETGGHSHVLERLSLDSMPTSPAGTAANFAPGMANRPFGGFFVRGADSLSTIVDTTDVNGASEVFFVPGFIGGEYDIIATAALGEDTLSDTARFVVRVPDLVNVRTTAGADAYFVGGKIDSMSTPPLPLHLQDSIWFATSDFRTTVTSLVAGLRAGGNYPQVNDLSLPYGGSYTHTDLALDSAGGMIDDPWAPHRSHGLGVDVDIGWCYTTASGMDEHQDHRVSPDTTAVSLCGSNGAVRPRRVMNLAENLNLRVVIEGDHWHIRPIADFDFVGVFNHTSP